MMKKWLIAGCLATLCALQLSAQEIHEFCMVNFNIEFPQFDKVEKPEASVKDLP